MSFHKIQSEVIDIQGIYTLAVYVHYFLPGSLKINSKVYKVPLGVLRELIEEPVPDLLRFENTRRWLPRGEAPYPGYCRAPGSAKCVPALCNCQRLKEVWNAVVQKKVELNNKKIQQKGIQMNQKENKDEKLKQKQDKDEKTKQKENKDEKLKKKQDRNEKIKQTKNKDEKIKQTKNKDEKIKQTKNKDEKIKQTKYKDKKIKQTKSTKNYPSNKKGKKHRGHKNVKKTKF